MLSRAMADSNERPPRSRVRLAMVALVAIAAAARNASAQTGIAVPELAGCDAAIGAFMSQYGIPGLALALTRDGRTVYDRAFGTADLAGDEPTQPWHLFRIASVSKSITSIAIQRLIEAGQLGLDDVVFGPGGLLADDPKLAGAAITDPRIAQITVRMLLEHTSGWDRDVDCIAGTATPYPWTVSGCDPIGFPLYVTARLGVADPVRREDLIRFLLEHGLDHDPGSTYAYSNIGYLVLAEIIEIVTGVPYEEFVRTDLLAPLGIRDLHIGQSLLAAKQEREVEYHGSGGLTLSCYGTGDWVPWEYGGFRVETMDGHGGWIATAGDLVRLLGAVDGFATKPDVLSPASITRMTTPSAANAYYAQGWAVNPSDNWWHTGSLDGTASEWVRTSGGLGWAILANSRADGGSAFFTALDELGWACVDSATGWPAHDLMAAPRVPATDLHVTASGAGAVTLDWTNGDGARRIVVVAPPSSRSAFPTDGVDYAAASDWASAAPIGDGGRVVYDGTGSTVRVTGLGPGATVRARVFEYARSAITGEHALYLRGDAPATDVPEPAPSGSAAVAALALGAIRRRASRPSA